MHPITFWMSHKYLYIDPKFNSSPLSTFFPSHFLTKRHSNLGDICGFWNQVLILALPKLYGLGHVNT